MKINTIIEQMIKLNKEKKYIIFRDNDGNITYWEDLSTGDWGKYEYDNYGNVIYQENERGIVFDNRYETCEDYPPKLEIDKIDQIESITFRGKNKIELVNGMMIDDIKKYRVVSTQPLYLVLREYYGGPCIILTRDNIMGNMNSIWDVQYR